MEKNKLINECLDYISELVIFLREEGYPITKSRLNELWDKYDALPYWLGSMPNKGKDSLL
jgi:hypothetical protein